MHIIGLSGVAGSGKDLCFELLSKRLKCIKLSLADSLKSEVNKWTIPNYNIDCLSCCREDKNLIRPLLVNHAKIRRDETKGRYWIDQLSNKIKKIKKTDYDFGVITDIRYNDYEKDEIFWLKKELNGILIHISQYSLENRLNHNGVKVFLKPFNEEEKRNDPHLKRESDFQIEWQFMDHDNSKQEIENFLLDSYIDPLIKNIKELTTDNKNHNV